MYFVLSALFSAYITYLLLLLCRQFACTSVPAVTTGNEITNWTFILRSDLREFEEIEVRDYGIFFFQLYY